MCNYVSCFLQTLYVLMFMRALIVHPLCPAARACAFGGDAIVSKPRHVSLAGEPPMPLLPMLAAACMWCLCTELLLHAGMVILIYRIQLTD